MPLSNHRAPYLVTMLKNYGPVTFFRHLLRNLIAITSLASSPRRVISPVDAHRAGVAVAPFAVRPISTKESTFSTFRRFPAPDFYPAYAGYIQ